MRINLNPPPAVAVEYDARGKRAVKVFERPHEAKAFYVAKLRANKNPAIRKP